MIAVVVSTADRASEHIFEQLLDVTDWTTSRDESRSPGEGGGDVYRIDGVEMRVFEEWHLELDGVAAAFDDPDLVVFASRHSGETGPLLTAHHTGNVGPAEYGGADRDLARAAPNAHSQVLEALAEHAPENYEIGMECTHHGPTDVGVPSMFVEVGSGPDQWDDPDAARAVARAILDLRGVEVDAPQEDSDDSARRHLVGFDGNHYVPRFERIVRETDWVVGHIAADWGLDELGDPLDNEDVLRAAFEESRAEYALIDGDRPRLERAIDELGYEIVGETWLRAVEGVPLSFARRVEDRLTAVDDGLRFGDPARGFDGDFEVIEMAKDLLDEAQGIDREATREAVEGVALAFTTEQSATLVGDRAAIADSDDLDELIEALADVLRSDYDEVTVGEKRVVARKEAFDPELAAKAGVPEGPKFGKLASGRPVEIDGETVEPEAVSREREATFSV
ncbi:D-tyrosyl-tRNA deacylase protein [Halorhabdus tiamatea SARL4B]|uniref:D-aminoacyl-tRNA deacylase n=1 Tax=Halorhabdus tiamatea SARL4B TaxID=1033806 RepID=S6D1R5_9EURY|nr:D-aminoacyl-tRNA deacylase [Halorhabdus tiamatea]ERJ06472.1 D-tyrosyl-tRNA deacylase protein [Halorhabdus tiamatea SARL4B]CCQ34363.1 D-aminoacyl-tRNA deacylase [Halorhabdus tiamatea SARL4B]